mgnify:CR=1 FL=1
MKEKSIEELIIASAEKEKKSKRRVLLLTLIPILVGLGFFAYTLNKSQKADNVIVEHETLKESTKILTNYRDSLNQISLRRNKVKDLIESYFHYDSIQKSDSIQMLLTDTLERYYLFKNVPKEDIKLRQEKHWKKYPNERTKIEGIPEVIIESDNSVVVFVTLDYSKKGEVSKDILTEFRLNYRDEINVIRAFKGIPESYMGIYFDE